MRTLLVVLAVLVPFTVHAQWRGDWSTQDTVLLAVNAALGGYDWGYTQWAVGHDGGEEANPRLGKHPSRARIDQGFSQVAVVALGVALTIPEKFRTPFLLLGVVAQFANAQGLIHGNDRMDKNPGARHTGLRGATAGAMTAFAIQYKW